MQETEGSAVRPPQPIMSEPGGMKPQRGGVILALGIVGIVVCFICGIIAWVLGSKDIQEMKDGVRDPSGLQLTKAGMICGIIGTVLGILGLLWGIVVLFIVGTGVLGAVGGCS